MREILFRAKRITTGDWVYGDLVRHYENQRRFIACDQLAYTYTECGIDRLVSERYHEVDPVTVGQFTGLLDKNGKRVFEGDIVRMHYFFENHDPYTLGVFEDETEVVGTVRISPLGTYTETENGAYDWGDYLQEPSEELEVIGTISDKEVSV
jgi:uncharacterized phage protein (TIGR01671 family)